MNRQTLSETMQNTLEMFSTWQPWLFTTYNVDPEGKPKFLTLQGQRPPRPEQPHAVVLQGSTEGRWLLDFCSKTETWILCFFCVFGTGD